MNEYFTLAEIITTLTDGSVVETLKAFTSYAECHLWARQESFPVSFERRTLERDCLLL